MDQNLKDINFDEDSDDSKEWNLSREDLRFLAPEILYH